MRMYIVYLPGGNNVSFSADSVDLISNKITFHKNGERIAFFNLDNICGWYERKEEKKNERVDMPRNVNINRQQRKQCADERNRVDTV